MPTLCYDISRLLSKKDTPFPTGIDRVDIAYAAWIVENEEFVIFVKQDNGEFIIVPQYEAIKLINILSTQWNSSIIITNKRKKNNYHNHKTLYNYLHNTSDICVYINVSHKFTYVEELINCSTMPNFYSVFYIHDIIPITHPQYVREGDSERMDRNLNTILTFSSLILVNSKYTKDTIYKYCSRNNIYTPDIRILTIGCEDIFKKSIDYTLFNKKFFLYVSTIEPRKNHRLLLSVWRKLYKYYGIDTPKLILIGKYGWNVENLAYELRSDPIAKHCIRQYDYIDDKLMFLLLNSCEATLNPSHVEGYGMPAIESLAMQKLTLCSDIAAYKESTKGAAIYLDPDDVSAWYAAICRIIDGKKETEFKNNFKVPTWKTHFTRFNDYLNSLIKKPTPKVYNIKLDYQKIQSYIYHNKSICHDNIIENVDFTMGDGDYHGENWWGIEKSGRWFGPENIGSLYVPGIFFGCYSFHIIITQQIIPEIIKLVEIYFDNSKVNITISNHNDKYTIDGILNFINHTCGCKLILYISELYNPSQLKINNDMRNISFMVSNVTINRYNEDK